MLNRKKIESCHFEFDDRTGPKSLKQSRIKRYNTLSFCGTPRQIKFKAKIMSKICENHVKNIVL